jgi:hypothetical protein
VNSENNALCDDNNACTVDICSALSSSEGGCEYTFLNCDDDIQVTLPRYNSQINISALSTLVTTLLAVSTFLQMIYVTTALNAQ